jgi:hypothetical protein
MMTLMQTPFRVLSMEFIAVVYCVMLIMLMSSPLLMVRGVFVMTKTNNTVAEFEF